MYVVFVDRASQLVPSVYTSFEQAWNAAVEALKKESLGASIWHANAQACYGNAISYNAGGAGATAQNWAVGQPNATGVPKGPTMIYEVRSCDSMAAALVNK